MDEKFILSCESTVDFPYDYITGRNIEVLFYSYTIDGNVYVDDMGRSEDATANFYSALNLGKRPQTSQINISAYEEYFEKLIKKGSVLHIAFGSGLSNSVSNALLASQTINEKYNDKKVVVIDSLCGCCGYGLLVDMTADLRDEGKELDEAVEWVNKNRYNMHHLFYSSDLTHLKRCGRVSGVTAFVGTLLNICPLFRVNKEGRIVVSKKVRGSAHALKSTISSMLESIKDGENHTGKICIAHSNCIAQAQLAKSEIQKTFVNVKEDNIKLYNIGTVIASHCGAGTVSVYYYGKERDE